MKLTALVLGTVLTLGSAAISAVQEPVYKSSDGVTLPRVIKEVKPRYSQSALQAKVQGTVWLRAVVQSDGSVGDVEVVRALEESLDAEAIKAAKAWEFAPGTREGKPVAVEITIELTFTLKK
jgi:protein TonB